MHHGLKIKRPNSCLIVTSGNITAVGASVVSKFR
jgi:hypothetical protein